MKPEGHKYPNKMKADWNLLGQGKSTETIKKDMKGKWTIRWENNNIELAEYEDLSHDVWNITSQSKGVAEYKQFFEDINKKVYRVGDVLKHKDFGYTVKIIKLVDRGAIVAQHTHQMLIEWNKLGKIWVHV